MASAPSGQNQVRSASTFSKRRLAVQRYSETIGTIAAALAKAQAQLVNPEKSLVGTIHARNMPAQNFYGFLKSSYGPSSLQCPKPDHPARS